MFSSSYTGSNSPFGNLTSSYRDLLRGAVAPANGAALTLTISGLTVGETYEFEFWSNRSSGVSSSVTATAGNSVSLFANTPNVDGSLGQFAIGTFVADNATQQVAFTGNNNRWVNAVQLRRLSPAVVPEPGTALFGLGLMGVALVRRR
jgi:hypothetical protein